MNRKILLGIAALMLAALACQAVSLPANTLPVQNRVVGSGKIASEPRRVVGEFSSVELAGSGDVNILLTNVQSVNVESDDNIVPLIETKVVDGKLIVSTKPGVDFTTSHGVIVTVGIKSLEHVTLSGSGKIVIGKMSGPELAIDLPGSGEITCDGTVDHLTINLPGSGNIMCEQLKAHKADATVQGSGTISLFADESLNASVPGSGTIRYEGNPPQVSKSVTGSGTITP